MEIKIIGKPEEIAALILELQERRAISRQNITMPRDEILLVSHGLKDGCESE